MTRSLLYRNALSVVLFFVALAGIVVQLNLLRHGIVLARTRLVLAGYVLIALYAAASIAVRVRAAKDRR